MLSVTEKSSSWSDGVAGYGGSCVLSVVTGIFHGLWFMGIGLVGWPTSSQNIRGVMA